MAKDLKKLKGKPEPLGNILIEGGVNFAVKSKHAREIVLCLFDETGKIEFANFPMYKTKDTFHVFIKGLEKKSLYAYRAIGEYDPHQGLRFNKQKLLIDPYAKELFGDLKHSKINHDYNYVDNAKNIPKSVVVDGKFSWAKVSKPKISLSKTVIYEAHVKGLTMLNPDVPKKIRGTFLGACHQSIISHLKDLNISTIEFLPIQSFITETFLTKKGLTNYWGYNTLNYFSVHQDYGTLEDFKTMVKTFHENDIEVIMDVVYNHTCEGNERGETYSFKGLDNSSYYHLPEQHKEYYENYTGCGNTFNLDNNITLDLVIDSLKYFANECQVDGFRFDLATSLLRNKDGIEDSKFLKAIQEDKELSDLKLIMEPWDIGLKGYQLGHFKNGFCEWNDVFRNSVRAFWKGNMCEMKNFVRVLSGSENIFYKHENNALSSINFLTAHDGFTLTDLVSYNKKHNFDNLEHNRDGHNDNLSYNHGIEGPTDDKDILNLRLRQKKNMIASLFLAKGTPMMLAGDEIGNSANGNNNYYCQDNEIGWINWEHIDENLLEFTKKIISLRLSKRKDVSDFYTSDTVFWYSQNGNEMTVEDWETPFLKHFLAYTYQKFIVLFNADDKDINFTLPFEVNGKIILNTYNKDSFLVGDLKDQKFINVKQKSMIVIELNS